MRDAFRRSMRPVSAAKSVIHIDVAKAGELTGELRIVGFFPGVEAHVLEEHEAAVGDRARGCDRVRADAIRLDGRAQASFTLTSVTLSWLNFSK